MSQLDLVFESLTTRKVILQKVKDSPLCSALCYTSLRSKGRAKCLFEMMINNVFPSSAQINFQAIESQKHARANLTLCAKRCKQNNFGCYSWSSCMFHVIEKLSNIFCDSVADVGMQVTPTQCQFWSTTFAIHFHFLLLCSTFYFIC